MTQLTFTITEPSDLVLSIRDVTGRTINTPVVMNNKAAGTYTMMINASSYDAGLYYVILESNSQTRSVKMLVTK